MNRFKPSIDRTIARLALDLTRSHDLSKAAALRRVLHSQTFELLHAGEETGLCFEMYQTVHHMFMEEIAHD